MISQQKSTWIIMVDDHPIGFVKAIQDEIAKITRHLICLQNNRID